MEVESTVTRMKEVMGTPSYMAPEQAVGNNAAVSSATDVYGLGAVLYQLLTGHPPFAGGTTYETIKLVLDTEPRRPRLWNRKIDRDLSTICLKCLEKDPKRRYSSALALAEDLGRWAKHEPIQARHSGILTRGKKWVRRNPSTAVLVTVLVAFAIGSGVMVWNRKSVPLIPKSVAVLPFNNLSKEEQNAYFADGVQDQILTDLSQIADLKVISRTSVMQYKSGVARNLRKIAEELGVAHVVEGSVQRAANKIRVSAQLIDARTDVHLWAQTYDRDLADVFSIHSEIAKAIADQLQAKLSPNQSNALGTAPTRDTEAYDLFLKGEYEEHLAENALSAESFGRAQMFYRQALARDPNFALAYARLAYSEFISNMTSAELAEVKSNIDRSLAIAPALADTHLALGVFCYWGYRDYDSALKALDRAIELQPNSATIRSFRAAIYRRRGDWQRSIAEFDQAAELDPRDSLIQTEIGVIYLLLHRWGDAEHSLSRALAIDPHNTLAARFLARTFSSTGDIRRARQAFEGVPVESKLTFPNDWGTIAVMIDERVYLDVLERRLADALKAWDVAPSHTSEARLRQLEARVGIQVLAGQCAAAKSECEQTRTLLEARLADQPEDPNSLIALAWVYVCLGRNADALRVARRAADLLPIEKDAVAGQLFLTGLAEIEARTGKPDEAVKILRQLIAGPSCGTVSIARLKIDPVWDPIRNDPGFQKLLSEPEPETIYK